MSDKKTVRTNVPGDDFAWFALDDDFEVGENIAVVDPHGNERPATVTKVGHDPHRLVSFEYTDQQ